MSVTLLTALSVASLAAALLLTASLMLDGDGRNGQPVRDGYYYHCHHCGGYHHYHHHHHYDEENGEGDDPE